MQIPDSNIERVPVVIIAGKRADYLYRYNRFILDIIFSDLCLLCITVVELWKYNSSIIFSVLCLMIGQ